MQQGADPYGPAPDSFTYEKVDEKTRAKTVKALNLDEADGRVEMRAARAPGSTLGTLVGSRPTTRARTPRSWSARPRAAARP